jgi:NAD(P)-dependent dehydrogenase (short-subunit alcohol dehydrogenase family)
MIAGSEDSNATGELHLSGQTAVVISRSSGTGFQTARRASAEGANVIIVGRDLGRLQRAATELAVRGSPIVDATDPAVLDRFFGGPPPIIDHVMVTAGSPYYARRTDLTTIGQSATWSGAPSSSGPRCLSGASSARPPSPHSPRTS